MALAFNTGIAQRMAVNQPVKPQPQQVINPNIDILALLRQLEGIDTHNLDLVGLRDAILKTTTIDIEAGKPKVISTPIQEQGPGLISTPIQEQGPGLISTPIGEQGPGLISTPIDEETMKPKVLTSESGDLAESQPQGGGIGLTQENVTTKKETGERREFFGITSGRERIGEFIVRIDRKGRAFVDNVEVKGGPQSLGTKEVISMLEKFVEEHPEITSIEGFRVSGGREKFGGKPTININPETIRKRIRIKDIGKRARSQAEEKLQDFMRRHPDFDEAEARRIFLK